MDYEEPAAVYRLYDTDGHLLYIGITRRPRSRWKDHRKEMLWWREVTYKTITWYATRWVAMHMEETAIVDERPLYNAREECDVPGLSPQPYGHRIAYQHRETRGGYRIQWFLWRLSVQDAWATEQEQGAPYAAS